MSGFSTARRMRVIGRAVFAFSGSMLAAIVFIGCGITLIGGSAIAQPKGDPSRGAAKGAACGSCHGSPKSPPLAGTPSLAGQQPEFMVLQMFMMREGVRDVPEMAGMLNGLSDQDLTDIAAYFAGQTFVPEKASRDPQLHARGASLSRVMGCGSCHLGDYSGQRQVPRITYQREDYLANALKAYRDNKRVGIDNTNMNAILSQLSDGDLQALAHYLAHQAR